MASIALHGDVENIPLQHGTLDGEIKTAEINNLASDNTSQMITLCYHGFDTWPHYRMVSSADDNVHELYQRLYALLTLLVFRFHTITLFLT